MYHDLKMIPWLCYNNLVVIKFFSFKNSLVIFLQPNKSYWSSYTPFLYSSVYKIIKVASSSNLPSEQKRSLEIKQTKWLKSYEFSKLMHEERRIIVSKFMKTLTQICITWKLGRNGSIKMIISRKNSKTIFAIS